MKRFLSVTRFFYRFLSTFNLIPVTWNDRHYTFHSHKVASIRYCLHRILYFWFSLEFSFGVGRLCELVIRNWPITRNIEALPELISIFGILGTKSGVFVLNAFMLGRKEEIRHFANQLCRLRRAGTVLRYLSVAHSHWVSQLNFLEKIRNDFPGAALFIFVSSVRSVQMAVIGCTKPNKKFFWYSVVPLHWKSSWIFGLHVLTCLSASLFCLTILFYVSHLLMYIETLRMLLKTKYVIKLIPLTFSTWTEMLCFS